MSQESRAYSAKCMTTRYDLLSSYLASKYSYIHYSSFYIFYMYILTHLSTKNLE